MKQMFLQEHATRLRLLGVDSIKEEDVDRYIRERLKEKRPIFFLMAAELARRICNPNGPADTRGRKFDFD